MGLCAMRISRAIVHSEALQECEKKMGSSGEFILLGQCCAKLSSPEGAEFQSTADELGSRVLSHSNFILGQARNLIAHKSGSEALASMGVGTEAQSHEL